MECCSIGPGQVWFPSWRMPPEPIIVLGGTASPLLRLSQRRREDQCPREPKHGSSPLRACFSDPLPAPSGWQRQKLPLGEQGMSHQKGGYPGEPAESLEGPFFFFDHFIPFFPPHLCFVRLSRTRLSQRGFRTVSPFPRHGWTDGLPVIRHAPSIRRALRSACQGLPGLKRRIVRGFF